MSPVILLQAQLSQSSTTVQCQLLKLLEAEILERSQLEVRPFLVEFFDLTTLVLLDFLCFRVGLDQFSSADGFGIAESCGGSSKDIVACVDAFFRYGFELVFDVGIAPG